MRSARGDKLTRVEVRELVVDGTPTEYRVAGEGPPLVLVHGLSGSWRWWRPVLEALAERHRVYVPELPKLGRRLPAEELTPWFARWLDAAGLERADRGRPFARWVDRGRGGGGQPERVRRLALIAPAGIPYGTSIFGRAVRLIATLFDLRRRLATIVGDALRAGPLSLLRGAIFASHRDLTVELASVQAPTLLVWGDKDRLLPPRTAAEWQRVLPRSRLVRLHCGHVPMWEMPRELASCLLDFLSEEVADDGRDEIGPGVVRGVGLTGDDDEAALR